MVTFVTNQLGLFRELKNKHLRNRHVSYMPSIVNNIIKLNISDKLERYLL